MQRFRQDLIYGSMRFGLKHLKTTDRQLVVVFLWMYSFWLSLHVCHCQIKILSPPQLIDAVELTESGSDSIPGATATFGAPSYGESLMGQLFNVPSNSIYCIEDYKDEIEQLISTRGSGDLRKIFVIRRGGCTFVRKTSVAETLGADAVIVIDSDDSTWTRREMASVIMADDGHGKEIHIPSVMITKEDGALLLNELQRSNVIVKLQWSLPQKTIVALDFWTESGSTAGQRFLKDYAYHANILQGHLRFTPHYNVYGLHSGAIYSVNSKLCLANNSNICSNPPDVLGSQVTGSDVLEEDVRQLCLWEVMAREVDGVPESQFSPEWWEYVRKFADSCPLVPPPGPRFGAECSYRVMTSIPGIRVEEVKKCATEKQVDLLIREKSNKAWSSLAVRINGAKLGGTLDPMQVSKAVCSAFESPPIECQRLTGLQLPQVHYGLSASTVILGLLFLGAVSGVALYLYQRYMRKSMRAALRHEVMLEVRSQLQEYHQLDEETDPSRRQKLPLIFS